MHFRKKPLMLGGFAFFIGYLKAFLFKEKKTVDKKFAKFINEFHYKRLNRMKRY